MVGGATSPSKSNIQERISVFRHHDLMSHCIFRAWALGLASLGNCAGHTGRDNTFHVLTGSKISDLYGDANPTERNAVAITLASVRKVFIPLSIYPHP